MYSISPGQIWDRTAGNVGAAHHGFAVTGLQATLNAPSTENLSSEAKQLCSEMVTTDGVQVQFKQQKKVLRQIIQCGICLQWLFWVKCINYKDTCSGQNQEGNFIYESQLMRLCINSLLESE